MRIDLNYYTAYSQYAKKTKVPKKTILGKYFGKANINDGFESEC